jgi:hypothetical protein
LRLSRQAAHQTGLGLHEITATAHILNVPRRRLARVERERKRNGLR